MSSNKAFCSSHSQARRGGHFHIIAMQLWKRNGDWLVNWIVSIVPALRNNYVALIRRCGMYYRHFSCTLCQACKLKLLKEKQHVYYIYSCIYAPILYMPNMHMPKYMTIGMYMHIYVGIDKAVTLAHFAL